MTSPGIQEPSSTQDKYDDVYSRGSSFGSDLTEESARALLATRISTPFAGVFDKVTEFVTGIVGGIADAIRGEGAGYEAVAGAVTERLGPINTQITAQAEEYEELQSRVATTIEQQTTINNQVASQNDKITALTTNLTNYQTTTNASITKLNQDASASVTAANNAVTQAQAAVTQAQTASQKADANVADIAAANTKAIEANNKADEAQNKALEAVNRVLNMAFPSSNLLGEVYSDVWRKSVPAWYTLAPVGSSTGIVSTSEGSLIRYISPALGQKADPAYVSVVPGQEYVVSFWGAYVTPNQTNANSTLLNIDLLDQDGNNAILQGGGASPKTSLITKQPITSSWRKYVYEGITLKPGVQKVTIGTIFNGDSLATGTDTNNGTFQIADLQLYPSIPSQAEINAEVAARQDLAEEFQTSQVAINLGVQDQLWMHQDTLELLDIHTPKAVGWLEKENTGTGDPPGGGDGLLTSYKSYDSTFFQAWWGGDNAYFGFKGNWVGTAELSVAWTNGAVDTWVVKVTASKRMFRLTGGNALIGQRAFEVVMYIDSLKRNTSVTVSSGKTVSKTYPDMTGTNYFSDVTDPNNLTRVKGEDHIRFRNAVTCDKAVVARDPLTGNKRTVSVGGTIFAKDIYPQDQTATGTYQFTEVSAEDFDYSIPNNLPTTKTGMQTKSFQ